MQKISDLLNDPWHVIAYPRYVEEGEKTAERFGPQPIIYYLLVIGGIVHLIYFAFFHG